MLQRCGYDRKEPASVYSVVQWTNNCTHRYHSAGEAAAAAVVVAVVVGYHLTCMLFPVVVHSVVHL